MNQQTKELAYTLDYYALAHFSAMIRPKAVRIDSTSSDPSICSVAFKNIDGSVALVLFNDGEETGNVQVMMCDNVWMKFQLERKSALSILIHLNT